MASQTNCCGVQELTEIAKDIICDKPKFRPLRTEEEMKRDDMANAIDGFISGFKNEKIGSNKNLAYALTNYLALIDKL